MDEQIAYLQDRVWQKRHYGKMLKHISNCLFAATVVAAAIVACNATGVWQVPPDVRAAATGCVLMLATLSAGARVLREKAAFEELEKRYNLTLHFFSTAKSRLQAGACSPTELVVRLGKEALIDNGDWLWTKRDTTMR